MTAERCCMIIDARPLVRVGIRRELGTDWDFEELPDGRGAIETLNSVGRIEVAIVEMRSAERGAPSGTATIRDLLHHQPALGVIAHGGRIERHAVSEAFDAGASAYVGKRSPADTMRSAIEAVADFNSFIDPAVKPDGLGPQRITRRQREILQFFADGLSTDDAASRLNLSPETVRTHAKACLGRLGARDRAHAVAIALRGSLID
jgi:two-component system NarL family response regulator